jgi:hypothetical protein
MLALRNTARELGHSPSGTASISQVLPPLEVLKDFLWGILLCPQFVWVFFFLPSFEIGNYGNA